MNVRLYNHHGSVDLWVTYSEWDGELQLESIYLGSDPARIDLIDFMSDSVLDHAEAVIHQDWIESAADRAEFIYGER